MNPPKRGPRRRNGSLAAALLALAGLVAASPGWGTPERSTAAAEVALTRGILAFQEGDFGKAVELFEEAVQWDGRNGTALHWLGLAHLKLCHLAQAVQRLDESLAAELPPEAGRGRVRADREMARELERREGAVCKEAPEIETPNARPLSGIPGLRPWSALIALEVGDDSNPGLLPRETLGVPVSSAGPAEATADQGLRLDLRLDLRPLLPRGGWTLGASFAGSQTVYRDLDDFDLSLVEASFSATRESDPRVHGRRSLVLQGAGTWVFLGGEEYLRMAEATASITFQQTTRFDLVVRERSLVRDGPGELRRSGGEASLSGSRSFNLGQADRTLRVGLLSGLREGGRAFESSFREAFAEASLPLTSLWELSLQGAYREERFDNPESRLVNLNGSARRDDSWRLSASLVWTATDHLRWTARASRLDNDSNIDDPFDHRRTVLALGTIWSLW